MTVSLHPETISLRKRLVLVPALIVAVVSVLAMIIIVHQARHRVLDEVVSSGDLADNLIREAVASLPPGTTDPLSAMDQLVRALPPLRHVRLYVLAHQGGEAGKLPGLRGAGRTAPRWFVRLLNPGPWERWREILYDGRILGYALIVADPADEIAELWDEMVLIGGLLLGLMAVFIGLVAWSVGRALQPIAQLSGGLDRLEKGEFTTSLPRFGIAELSPLGEKFNALAQSLAKVSADNRFLIGQLISLQETERNVLARELHDELGPCLFGIKAQAACIARLGQGEAQTAHARTILGLVDELQKLNRRILGSLRPMALGDLGLADALAQLVEDWRSRKPDVDWQVNCAALEAPPDDAVALTLYRVAQECLTNAARHSGAKRVSLDMESGAADEFAGTGVAWHGASDARVAYLSVKDDGQGLTEGSRWGFGLLGIHERVRGHGGVARISCGEGGGVCFEAMIPLDAVRQGEVA